LIVSLTEEEQAFIEQIAEQVINGGLAEEKNLKAQSSYDERLR